MSPFLDVLKEEGKQKAKCSLWQHYRLAGLSICKWTFFIYVLQILVAILHGGSSFIGKGHKLMTKFAKT